MDQAQQTIRRTRHKWAPVLVLIGATAWWLWRANYARYHTIVHIAVLLLSVMAVAGWFLVFGGGSRRKRRAIVGSLTLVLIVFLVVFRPVYNGDMGVYRWRLRFASSADEKLEQLKSVGEAS